MGISTSLDANGWVIHTQFTAIETNGWKWPMFMVGYLFLLAYAAAGITYWTAVAFGLG